jgi:hypothetical protein
MRLERERRQYLARKEREWCKSGNDGTKVKGRGKGRGGRGGGR